MKRLIALLLAFCLLLTSCRQRIKLETPQTPMPETKLAVEDVPAAKPAEWDFAEPEEADTQPEPNSDRSEFRTILPEYSSLSDPALLDCVEDSIYAELVAELPADYFVENVSAVYISNEYLEELSYNSQSNIFFGYTLAELDEQFQGTRYVFTLSDSGETGVEEFEAYDDTFEHVIKNVAVGTGVILVCMTVSVVSGGIGAPSVSVIFAASAKTGATMAVLSGGMGAVGAGIVTGIQTKDFDSAMRAAALAGSEGFKYGAISGAISGGMSEAIDLKGATLNGLTMNEAATIQKESKYPLDVIKEFKNMEQYNICKSAGLSTQMVDGKAALIRDIDLNFTDELGRTNLERMLEGSAALDSATGKPYELHHMGQKADSTLAILTKSEHMQGGNNEIWHEFGKASEVHVNGNNWDSQRKIFWVSLAESLS